MDSNKYTSGNAEKLMTGEIGKLLGVRFLETSNAYTRGSSYDTTSAVIASSTLYVTSFFGQDAFGVTDLQNLKSFVKDTVFRKVKFVVEEEHLSWNFEMFAVPIMKNLPVGGNKAR